MITPRHGGVEKEFIKGKLAVERLLLGSQFQPRYEKEK
jgi:hypothetical protein